MSEGYVSIGFPGNQLRGVTDCTEGGPEDSPEYIGSDAVSKWGNASAYVEDGFVTRGCFLKGKVILCRIILKK